jgi:V8-like Glu-specific endopeptidase
MSSDPLHIQRAVNNDPDPDTCVPDPPGDSKPFDLPTLQGIPDFFHPTLLSDPTGAGGQVPPNAIHSNPVIHNRLGHVHAVTSQGFFPTVGRLYARRGTEWRHSTAQFVGRLNVILTAAHCVFNRDLGFFDDYLFYADYHDGHFKSKHRWQCTAIYNGWTQEDYYYDFAFVRLLTPSPGTAVLGLKANSGRSPMTSVGYAENHHHGKRAVYVNGPVAPAGAQGTGILCMRQNDFLGGSSGGAWVYDQYAESVNSFGITGDDNDLLMFGPQFGPPTLTLYQYVSGGC